MSTGAIHEAYWIVESPAVPNCHPDGCACLSIEGIGGGRFFVFTSSRTGRTSLVQQ